MKTEDIDKKIGMPDVDAEWARFEREVIGSADVSSAKGSAGPPAPHRQTVLAWIGGLAIAASILLLFMLNMGKDVAKEAPLVAQQIPVHEENTEIVGHASKRDDSEPVVGHASKRDDSEPVVGHASKRDDNEPVVGHASKRDNSEDTQPSAATLGSVAHYVPDSSRSENIDKPEIKVFASVEQSASFPGGDRACLAFIEENLRTPELATTYGVKARVIITFLVGKTGELSNIKVIRNNMVCDSTLISQLPEAEQTQIKEQLTQQLSEEAVRIVSIMPRWRPANINGETQEQRYTLPIRFNH